MIVGNAGRWSRAFRSIEERLAKAIDEVWPSCLLKLVARVDGGDPLEDPITRALVFGLRQNKSFPGRIITQYEILREEPGGITAPSRIDFVVTIGDDEDDYLACECKRLNVSYDKGCSTGAHAYVHDGLSRFAQRRYSNGLPFGVMLGYVMDGRVDDAANTVAQTIASAAAALALAEPHSSLPSPRWRRFRTRHFGRETAIEVRHTMLPMPSAIDVAV